MKHYILDANKNVVEAELLEWAVFLDENDGRRVVATQVGEDVRVSTVFLGSDHSFGRGDRPVVFETLVFGGDLGGEMNRCCTWTEAWAMHANMLRRVLKAYLNPSPNPKEDDDFD